MSDEVKPREFLIAPHSMKAFDIGERVGNSIHVIEKSAYYALKAEKDGLHVTLAEVLKERDTLKAENEEIMETLEEVHKTNKILETENERLSSELDRERDVWHEMHNKENGMNAPLREMCEKLAGALKFYEQGAQVIGFERGERAREALAEYEKLKVNE